MGKKSKISKKRAARRERAKSQNIAGADDELLGSLGDSGEALPVKNIEKVEPEAKPAPAKKAPKAVKDVDEDNGWDRLKRFFTDVKIEALKINWPAIDETWKSTWVTVFVIIVMSVFMGITSAFFQEISGKLFGVGSTSVVAPLDVSGGAIDQSQVGSVPTENGDSGTGDTAPVNNGE